MTLLYFTCTVIVLYRFHRTRAGTTFSFQFLTCTATIFSCKIQTVDKVYVLLSNKFPFTHISSLFKPTDKAYVRLRENIVGNSVLRVLLCTCLTKNIWLSKANHILLATKTTHLITLITFDIKSVFFCGSF